MIKRILVSMCLALLLTTGMVLAQTAGVPVSPTPPVAGFDLVGFVRDHWAAVIAPFLVALFDLGFAVNSNWRSNGIAHWVYLALGGKDTAALK